MRYPEFAQTPSMGPYYEQTAENLKAAWQRLREDNPMLRIRDAAEQLGVSEAELLALSCRGTATRLDADWAGLILSLPKLGRVMALTRNDHAVHEKHGRYGGDSAAGAGPEDVLELRLFPELWRFGYAAVESGRGVQRHSLQFFDAHGHAVHKVYLTEASHRLAYETLVERYAAPDQSPWQEVAPEPFPAAEPSGGGVDPATAQEDWRRIQEAHGFLTVIGQRSRGRLRALLPAGPDTARPVSNASAEHVLTLAADAGLLLEISVASPGAVQTHSGTVHNIQRTGPWINVLDEGFNLHLRDARLASSWAVRETTAEGDLASLELFDGRGQPVARFRAARRPGEPEPAAWRDVLEALPAAEVPA
jgi:putative hemin transport protein